MNIILNRLTKSWCNQVKTSHKIQIRYFEIRTLNSVLKIFGSGPKGREGLLDLGENLKITMDSRTNRAGIVVHILVTKQGDHWLLALVKTLMTLRNP